MRIIHFLLHQGMVQTSLTFSCKPEWACTSYVCGPQHSHRSWQPSPVRVTAARGEAAGPVRGEVAGAARGEAAGAADLFKIEPPAMAHAHVGFWPHCPDARANDQEKDCKPKKKKTQNLPTVSLR